MNSLTHHSRYVNNLMQFNAVLCVYCNKAIQFISINSFINSQHILPLSVTADNIVSQLAKTAV